MFFLTDFKGSLKLFQNQRIWLLNKEYLISLIYRQAIHITGKTHNFFFFGGGTINKERGNGVNPPDSLRTITLFYDQRPVEV